MNILKNPLLGTGPMLPAAPFPSVNAERVALLLGQCPAAKETALHTVQGLVPVTALWVKDERARMNLGSFKALGAAYVIARHAADISLQPDSTTLKNHTYVTASAGNHGLSVAAGARVFGAKAVVFLSETVPAGFADRLRNQGAEVIVEGADYAASMVAAAKTATNKGWTLLSDSSWEGYTDIPHLLMEGYLQMAAEAAQQCPQAPTHIFLQAGVGGLAGAVAAYARRTWGDTVQIIVVEPTAAPALQASIKAGEIVFADGPDSIMGRLDCKEASMIAVNGLARDANAFLTISDEDVAGHLPAMAAVGLATSASGGAGLAALMMPEVRDTLEIGAEARVLCFLSEVEDG